MKKFMVAYKSGLDGSYCEKEMTGNELAHLYGFSDCSGDDILSVCEISPFNGRLTHCRIWEEYPRSHNVLYVHRDGNHEPYEYEWEEH